VGEAYSVYWSRERWIHATARCAHLTVLFGGPHTSLPSFRRATVQPGDLLYPIGVCRQVLYVFGRLRVKEIVAVGGASQPRPEDYFRHGGDWRFLKGKCISEVVIGTEDSAIHLDRPLPGEVTKRLVFAPRRGPRPIKHVSDDGRLVHSVPVQGIYRLSESSAADIEAVLAGPPGQTVCPFPPRHRQPPPHFNMDPLF
jgi:hypothetical protein